MGVGDRCEGKEEKPRLWIWLQTACCVQRKQECGSGREWRCCDLLGDALLFLTDIWTPPAIRWKYPVSSQWFIGRETNRQTRLRAKRIIKSSPHCPRCWLHYDPLECEWAFKAVMTLATRVCVQPAFRPMWATFVTRGTLEHVISQ